MPLLPTKNYSDQANAALLSKVKKGNKEAQSEFVWQNQSQFYAIAFMATNNKQASLQLCIDAFKQSLAALEQFQHQQLVHLDWDWLSQFIVNACAQFHAQYSHVPNTPITDPSADGSAQLDFGKNTVLDTQKIKMLCVNSRRAQKSLYSATSIRTCLQSNCYCSQPKSRQHF